MATASMASAAGLAAYQQKSQMLSNPTYLPPQPSEIVYTLNIEFLDGSTDIITDIRDVGVTDGYVWYVTKGDLDSTDYIPLTSIKRYRRSMTTI